MIRCPKCKKEIDFLVVTSTSTVESALRDYGGRPLREDEKVLDHSVKYECPDCSATLGLCDDSDAADFLKGAHELNLPTYPADKIPEFYLESKHADIKASRGEDFHYSWAVGWGQLLTVEYIPANWPSVTVSIATKSPAAMKETLREIGFEIEGDDEPI
uniref:Uncharacterized protein n=1 Tax=viral metagenome TaxID=1070528 RepID=A0A6M3KJP6_9ZZZZ